MLSSCAPLESFLATPTLPPVPGTALPSPTIVWFPPSATPSPQYLATQAPTPERRPGLQEVFVTDALADASLWDTAASNDASARIDDHQLTLAAQSGVYIISLRHELILDDFYVEMTARPSLCRANDSYGLLVRANAVAGYRFSLSCDGSVGVERVSVGKHLVLHPAIPSGDAPAGAPGEVRIGVWAVGNEMRLFLNGHYQFSVIDSNYASGTVGVFVIAAGTTAATVSFADLRVQHVQYSPPTATPKP